MKYKVLATVFHFLGMFVFWILPFSLMIHLYIPFFTPLMILWLEVAFNATKNSVWEPELLFEVLYVSGFIIPALIFGFLKIHYEAKVKKQENVSK